MAKWDNQKLVSNGLCRGPGFDSMQFLFFSCVYQELKVPLINDKSNTQENKCYYIYCICIVLSWAPYSYLHHVYCTMYMSMTS